MTAIFGAIENAILARLKAASAADLLGYHYRALESLPDDLDDNLPAAVKDYPAGWTVWKGWAPGEAHGDGTATVTAAFGLVVAAASLRNSRAERFGVEGEVGSYQLVADACGLLMGQSFGLPMSGLELGACRPIGLAKNPASIKASFFLIDFTAQVEIDPVAPGVIETPAVGDFATFAVGWDLPPFTGTADSSQTITLEQDA